MNGYDLDGTIFDVRPHWLFTLSIKVGVHGKQVLGKHRWKFYRWLQRYCGTMKLKPDGGVIITARTRSGMEFVRPWLHKQGIDLPVIHRPDYTGPQDGRVDWGSVDAKAQFKAEAILRLGVKDYYENEPDQAILIQSLVGSVCRVHVV